MTDNDNTPQPAPAIGYTQVYQPTLAERFWHWAGFHHAFVPLPDIDDGQGTLTITTTHYWSLGDRLRILISGRSHQYSRSVTDLPVNKAETMVSISVLPPSIHGGMPR